MKIILALFFSLTIFMPFSLLALEKGKWKIEKSDQYCWIGSLAIDSDLSPDKKRGDYYVVVYKNLGNPETIVQVEAGYDYKIGENIQVQIDKGIYNFYTTEDLPSVAWTEEDNKVIFAMKKGLELVVTGKSSRGTTTNDKYTLNGFTAAYNQLLEDC